MRCNYLISYISTNRVRHSLHYTLFFLFYFLNLQHWTYCRSQEGTQSTFVEWIFGGDKYLHIFLSMLASSATECHFTHSKWLILPPKQKHNELMQINLRRLWGPLCHGMLPDRTQYCMLSDMNYSLALYSYIIIPFILLCLHR